MYAAKDSDIENDDPHDDTQTLVSKYDVPINVVDLIAKDHSNADAKNPVSDVLSLDSMTKAKKRKRKGKKKVSFDEKLGASISNEVNSIEELTDFSEQVPKNDLEDMSNDVALHSVGLPLSLNMAAESIKNVDSQFADTQASDFDSSQVSVHSSTRVLSMPAEGSENSKKRQKQEESMDLNSQMTHIMNSLALLPQIKKSVDEIDGKIDKKLQEKVDPQLKALNKRMEEVETGMKTREATPSLAPTTVPSSASARGGFPSPSGPNGSGPFKTEEV